ncbi:MAG: hypothetical protein LH614_14785 [Pyrinomonadaceae bacterium]|nr:hypothetical protein [Pyrinomonadaceae bacterium]
MLARHDWLGNVRELENVVSYVIALGGNLIDAADLPAQFQSSNPKIQNPKSDDKTARTLAGIEKIHILQTLESVNGNRVRAAEILGVDRRTSLLDLQRHIWFDGCHDGRANASKFRIKE